MWHAHCWNLLAAQLTATDTHLAEAGQGGVWGSDGFLGVYLMFRHFLVGF